MKKITLFVCTLLFTVAAYSQEMLPGYYVTTYGKKIDGYFKLSNFYNSNSLDFKESDNSEYIRLDSDMIKEYGIGTDFKFEKHNVEVDVSDFNESKLSGNKDPEMIEVTAFLNVIVEGDATLYSYDYRGRGTKYFYNIKSNNNNIKQLIYKKYRPSQIKILENAPFRQELYNYLKCNNEPMSNFYTVEYEKGALTDIFINYNKCNASQYQVYMNEGGTKTKLVFSFFAGVHSNTFNIKNRTPSFDNSSQINPSFGAEAALRLASEKVEFFARLEYEILKNEINNTYEYAQTTYTTYYILDVSALNVQVGPRYNFLLNDSNKIYIDGAFGLSIPFGDIIEENSTIQFGGTDLVPIEYSLRPTLCGNVGVGYTLNNQYSLEIRYETNRNMFTTLNTGYETQISRIGVNLKYTLK